MTGLTERMPIPFEFLALARSLSAGSDGLRPNDAELRRAVSTAYYALFHKVVHTAADRFMGPGQQNSKVAPESWTGG